MVVFVIKKSNDDQFLYEASVQETNDELIAGLVAVWNKRLRLGLLVGAIRELAKYGPMKPQDEAGIDTLKEQYEGAAMEKSEFYQADPAGVRTGNGPGPQLAETLERVCSDAEAALSANLVKQRTAVSMDLLDDKLANMQGAVMMAYPMGLPAWDTVALALEGDEGLDGTQASAELMDPETATLWVASRDFQRGQKVGDRLGWNEKTKVVAKLQKSGSGPPAREPVVSEEERKAMMAHYFKRQEELKKLAEASDDDYLASSWADPKAMKKSLQGTGTIKAPGLSGLRL
mmetsp:Transcript_29385/g.50720  ORF Transcript_29385/g.50720 Transcript_29385/m.50720 type:complete len:288 (-) Transcript_29385:69-932(-)